MDKKNELKAITKVFITFEVTFYSVRMTPSLLGSAKKDKKKSCHSSSH